MAAARAVVFRANVRPIFLSSRYESRARFSSWEVRKSWVKSTPTLKSISFRNDAVCNIIKPRFMSTTNTDLNSLTSEVLANPENLVTNTDPIITDNLVTNTDPIITDNIVTNTDHIITDNIVTNTDPIITDNIVTNTDPIITDNIVNITDNISPTVLEPTFSSLGLAGSSPIGLVQQIMETIHISGGLPWWLTIITTTIAFRTLMMPLVIKGQANAAKLNNIKPELDELTQKLREVANQQDNTKKAEASKNLQDLFQKHNCHPFKSLIIPVVQIPLFISFFIGLRRMANLPVESMKTGGLLWFPDLTMADPYFMLPILCSASMLLTIEAGAEAGVSNPQFKNIKQVFRIMAIMMIPLTAKFPTAIFTYWLTSNAFSLGQMIFLRITSVRKFFGIPKMTDHSKNSQQSGGFLENFKAGYKNSQNLAIIRQKEKDKQKAIKMASEQPLQQTYKENPLAEKNTELFQKSRKQRRTSRQRREKFTNQM